MYKLIKNSTLSIKPLLAIMLFMCCNQLRAQAPYWTNPITDSSANFFLMVDSAEAYYDTIPIDTFEGGELAMFQRWKNYWQPRVDESGSFISLLNADLELFEGSGVCNSTGNHINPWSNVGHKETENGPAVAGQGWVESIDINSNGKIYLGSRRGGLWESTSWTNGEPNWNNLTDVINAPTYGIVDVQIDPLNDNIIYIASASTFNLGSRPAVGLGLLKSSDGGTSWQATDLTRSNTIESKEVLASVIFVSSVSSSSTESTTLFVGKGNELFKSTNSAQSFSKLNTDVNNISQFGGPIHQIKEVHSNGNHVFVSTENGELWHTLDLGATWTQITSMNKGPNIRFMMDISASNDNLFLIYRNSSNRIIIESSSTTTISFTSTTSHNFLFRDFTGFQVSGLTNRIMYFTYRSSNHMELHYTFNNGVNFIRPSFTNWHPDANALLVQSDLSTQQDKVYVVNDGGINLATFSYNVNSSGVQVLSNTSTRLNGNGLTITEVYSFDIDNKDDWIVAGCQDLGDYHRINGDWQTHTFNDGFSVQFNPYGVNDQMFAEFNNRKVKMYEPGPPLNFTWAFPPIFDNNGIEEMHVDNEGNLYYGVFDKIYRKSLLDPNLGHPNEWADLNVANTRIKGLFSYNDGNNETIYVGFVDPGFDDVNKIATDKDRLFKYTKVGSAQGSWEDLGENSGLPIDVQGITEVICEPNEPDHVWVCLGSKFREFATTADVKRIFYSEDGGSTWASINNSLEISPGKPLQHVINDIELDESTGVLYAATDVGVFYNINPKSSNSPWECYNDQLPICLVTQLRIDYCRGKLMASTLGRGLWECNLVDEPRVTKTFDQTHLLNVALGSKRFANYDIVIPSGETFVVKGELLMAAESSITIETNAKLIIDGGTISSTCGQWHGIIVEGDVTKAQTPLNQGMVEIINGGTIEHAKEAIQLAGFNATGGIDWQTTGGIVKVDDGKFINNTRDVQFLAYQFRPPGVSRSLLNTSYFKNCEFSTTGDYRGSNTTSNTHVTLWKVDGVKFTGCHFHDDRAIDIKNHMDGIKSIGSTYRIGCIGYSPLTNCSSTKTKFENLRYAVQSFDGSTASNPQWSSTIESCEFTDNLGGILHSCVSEAVITNNTVDVSGVGGQTGFREIEAYGLYLDGCNGYQLEGNKMKSDFDIEGTSGDHAVGLIVRQNENRNNDVYHNFFDNFYIGTETTGWNRDKRGGDWITNGLKLVCNEYATPTAPVTPVDNYADILTVDDISITLSAGQQGLPQQGSSNEPSGNLFGDYPLNGSWNFDNVTPNQIDYFHHNPNSEIRVVPEYVSIENVNGTPTPWVANNQTTVLFDPNTSCPDKTNSGINIGTGESGNIGNTRLEKQSSANTWNQLTDGGNTTQVITDIQNATAGTVPGLVVDLLNTSPYLSLEVLEELAGSYAPFSHLNIKDVLIANPHGGRSASILEILANRTDNFPTNYILQIDSMSDSITSRDSLLFEIYDHNNDYARQLKSVLRRGKLSTTDKFSELIEPLLLVADEPEYKYLLVEYYDDRNEGTKAFNTLAAIPGQFDLTTEQSDYHTDYLNLRNTLLSWKAANKNFAALDSPELTYLQSIAAKSNGIERQVRPLLELNNVSTYLGPIYDIPAVLNQPFQENDLDKEIRKIESPRIENTDKAEYADLKLYPNPANQRITFEYNIHRSFQTAGLYIYNALGIEIKSVDLKSRDGQIEIDLTNTPEGIYYCKLQVDDQIVGNSSYTVKH